MAGQPTGDINYIRNSVKAVVNAYTGSVTLYDWDASDPILQTWMKAFPGVIKPKTDIPAALMPHLRYPPDLFEVQRQILTQFHVLAAQSFYGGQNFWAVPDEPSQSNGAQAASQPPYYQTMQMPGTVAQFSMTSPLVQRGRQNLAAYMAVDSNPQSPGYGTIRVLQLPQDTAILGPQQVQGTFESDPIISSQLSLYRQNGSKVIEGNLITLPVGRRAGLRGADLHPGGRHHGRQQLRLVPGAQAGRGLVRRERRVRADPGGRAQPGHPGPVAEFGRVLLRFWLRLRLRAGVGQRDRARVPGPGRVGVRPGPGGPQAG